MSDTVVVMDKGRIQQIGTPEDIYNEPKNAFVADFIGESNILNGVMVRDKVVKMYGKEFPCVDGGLHPRSPPLPAPRWRPPIPHTPRNRRSSRRTVRSIHSFS